LWRGYESTLSSAVADLNNNPAYRYAGAITAALFLNRFVEKTESWAHLDIPAWIDRPRPGRPLGGEANGARALYALLTARYGSPALRRETPGGGGARSNAKMRRAKHGASSKVAKGGGGFG
jgi:hypothetical protein